MHYNYKNFNAKINFDLAVYIVKDLQHCGTKSYNSAVN